MSPFLEIIKHNETVIIFQLRRHHVIKNVGSLPLEKYSHQSCL
jgi:hypothetical protein